MSVTPTNLNTFWSNLLIEEFIRQGVDMFCISPGSRSTPLTAAVAHNSRTRKKIFIDERGASFFALGYARAKKKPAVLISTSGTAVANYFPAVVEASLDNVPMIILSADRPPELQAAGANQTIFQNRIFGNYPRWFFELPTPDTQIDPRMVLTTVDQAVYWSIRNPAGPVHINCRFREPLEPTSDVDEWIKYFNLTDWQKNQLPFTTYTKPLFIPEPEEVEKVCELLEDSNDGIIFVGKLNSVSEQQSVMELAQQLNWPLFPDIQSGLRMGNTLPNLIPYFDQILLSEKIASSLKPRTVLHIGGQPTSKRFLQWLASHPFKNYLVVKDHPFRHDPNHIATLRIESDIAYFARQVSERIGRRQPSDLLTLLKPYSDSVRSTISAYLQKIQGISEMSVSRVISQQIPADHGLYLASSMPIREMDMYADEQGPSVQVVANRGASGIDGTIASALGFAEGLQQPVTLLIGDLAFIHDLNSLHLLSSASPYLTIVLLNNFGGGIFSFLPIAQHQDIFEEFFGTPHEFTFRPLTKIFPLQYFNPKTAEEFRQIYQQAIQSKNHTLIEINTHREQNFREHQILQKEIREQLTEQF